MSSSHDELVRALRKSLKENERLKKENRDYLASATQPMAVVGMANETNRMVTGYQVEIDEQFKK